jgi:hypothetical protein
MSAILSLRKKIVFLQNFFLFFPIFAFLAQLSNIRAFMQKMTNHCWSVLAAADWLSEPEVPIGPCNCGAYFPRPAASVQLFFFSNIYGKKWSL